MPHKKPNLPEKRCLVCGRPFQWRKKWAKVWDEVKYCSGKCRKNRGVPAAAPKKHDQLKPATFTTT